MTHAHDPKKKLELEAEMLFSRAKNLIERGAHESARAELEKAYAMAPELPGLHEHVRYVEYLLIPKQADGTVTDVERARAIYAELDERHWDGDDQTDWSNVLLGVVALGLGHDKRAGSHFHQALDINPNNIEAKRRQRFLEMKRARPESNGFFQQLATKLGLSKRA